MGPGIRLETKESSNINKETDNNPSYKARVYVCILYKYRYIIRH